MTTGIKFLTHQADKSYMQRIKCRFTAPVKAILLHMFFVLSCVFHAGCFDEKIPSADTLSSKFLSFVDKPALYSSSNSTVFRIAYSGTQSATFKCLIEQISPPSSSGSSFQACTEVTSVSDLLHNTAYRFTARAYDAEGELVDQINYTWNVDLQWDSGSNGGYPNVTYNNFTNLALPENYAVNSTNSLWLIGYDASGERPYEMGYVVNTSPTSTATPTNWMPYASTINVQIPGSGTYFIYFFFRDQAGNTSTSPGRRVQAYLKTNPPTTTVFQNQFTVPSMTLKIDATKLTDQTKLIFGYKRPTDTESTLPNAIYELCDPNSNIINAAYTPNTCNDVNRTLMTLLIRLQRPLDPPVTITDQVKTLVIPEAQFYNSNYVASAIAAHINRSITADANGAGATNGLSGFAAPVGTPNPKSLLAYAVNDVVIFTPTPYLAYANADYNYGNNFVLVLKNNVAADQVQAALKIPDYYSGIVYMRQTDVSFYNGKTITIRTGLGTSTDQKVFEFTTTNPGATYNETTGMQDGQNYKVYYNQPGSTDSIRNLASKLANAINTFYTNSNDLRYRNVIKAYMVKTKNTATDFEVRLFRQDGSNNKISVTNSASTIVVACGGFEDPHCMATAPKSPTAMIDLTPKHPFVGYHSFTALADEPSFGPKSATLDGSFNDSTYCSSLGVLTFSGYISDTGISQGSSATLEYIVKKINNEQGQAVSGNVCFNGRFDSSADMNSGCTAPNQLTPQKITRVDQQPTYVYNVSVPKCALIRGGSGRYRMELRAVDHAGNREAVAKQIVFNWKSTKPVSPVALNASTVPGIASIRLDITRPSGDLSNLNVLIIRRSATCDKSQNKDFCDFELPKNGASYAQASTEPSMATIGGTDVIVANAPAATTTAFIDTSLIFGTRYYYRVFYQDIWGNVSDGQQTIGTPDLPFACPGTLVVDDNFTRNPSSMTNPGTTPSGIPWIEFDQAMNDAVSPDYLGDLTNIINNQLFLNPSPSVANGRDFIGGAFIDLQGALTYQGSPFPSYETWWIVTADGPLTKETGLELQAYSHIKQITTKGLAQTKRFHHGNLYDGAAAAGSRSTFGHGDNFGPWGATSGTSVRPTMASHIMGKFDIDISDDAVGIDTGDYLQPIQGHTVRSAQQGIYYYSDNASTIGGSIFPSPMTTLRGYVGFSDRDLATSLISDVTDAPEKNNYYTLRPYNPYHPSGGQGFYYMVGMRVHINADTCSNGSSSGTFIQLACKAGCETSQTPWHGAYTGHDDHAPIYDHQGDGFCQLAGESFPDAISRHQQCEDTNFSASGCNSTARFYADDGNLLPDTQVSFIVKRFETDGDGNIVKYSSTPIPAIETPVVDPAKLPTGKFQVITQSLSPTPPTYTGGSSTHPFVSGNEAQLNACQFQASKSSSMCPPGTLMNYPVPNALVGTSFPNSDYIHMMQDDMFGAIRTGTGAGLRARFRGQPGTSAVSGYMIENQVPSVKVLGFKACETNYGTDLDAWAQFPTQPY